MKPKILDLLFQTLKTADPNTAVFSVIFLNLPILLVISQFNDFFSDTIGYGLSITVQSLCLWSVFSPMGVESVVIKACMFHGFRLALYLYLRDINGWRPYDPNKALPRVLRIPESLGLSAFFAILMSPTLYLLRSSCLDASASTILGSFITCLGAVLAWCGTILETVADVQKFSVKLKQPVGCYKNTEFHGPSEGPYRWCRHPNYFGELVFWTGLWFAALPTFYRSFSRFTIASTGLIGIYIIILEIATKHSEKLQLKKYSGQERYEKWRKQVPAVTIPSFVTTNGH